MYYEDVNQYDDEVRHKDRIIYDLQGEIEKLKDDNEMLLRIIKQDKIS